MMEGIASWSHFIDEIFDECHQNKEENELLKHPEVEVLRGEYLADDTYGIPDALHAEDNPQEVDEHEGEEDSHTFH